MRARGTAPRHPASAKRWGREADLPSMGGRLALTTESSSLVTYLEEIVHPALFEKLDLAFPEFGWRRTPTGWVATNRALTKERFGVRPDRVICHRPFGFLIHGGRPHTWCAYLHGGPRPRGQAFRRAVAALAARAGVPPPGETASLPRRDPRPEVLEHLLRAAHRRLVAGGDPEAEKARAALQRRGLGADAWAELELGLTPPVEMDTEATQGVLHALGLTHAHWANRIVGPWRDGHGEVAAVFGRRLEGPGAKYLCSRGPRPPLFGLPLPDPSPAVILVEGLFDALALRAAGLRNVVAAGGTQVPEGAWRLLEALGCRDLTLWLDTGRAGPESPPGGHPDGHARSPRGLSALRRPPGRSAPSPRAPDAEEGRPQRGRGSWRSPLGPRASSEALARSGLRGPSRRGGRPRAGPPGLARRARLGPRVDPEDAPPSLGRCSRNRNRRTWIGCAP